MEKETFVLVDNVPTKKAIDGSIIMESSNYFNLTEQEVCGGDKEISKNSQKKTYPTVRCTTDIFCWLKCVYESVRLKVKIENPEKATLPIMKQYLKFIRDDVPSCTRFPNRCYILSRNVTRTLLLFKGLNRNFTDTHEYLSQLSELLTIYTTLELIYSTKFEESKIAVANRISLNYDVHLKEFDQIYIIKILISIKNFYQQKEVMRKLFEKYLKRKCVCASQKELPDKIFVMYLIAYKYWISLEDDLDEKSKIEDIANAFMRPSTTLRRNYLYAPYIPAYKVTNQNATKCILSQSFNLLSLTKAVENDEQRTGRSPSRDIIDLSVCCDDNHLDLTQNESSEVVAFPKVKLERPEIIATVDLTTCKWDHDLNWLDTLIGKVRSLCSVSSCMNIVEIIDLDNDTTENIHDPEVSNTNDNCTETVSIEKSANNMSKLNNLSPNDLETGMDSPFGINKMNKDNESTEIVSFAAEVVNSTSFLRQNVNLSTKSTEHINESPLNADDNLRPEIDIRSHTEKIIWSQPVPKASKSDDIQDEANDQGADMSCLVNCGASDQLVSSVRIPANEVKEDETNQNVDPESSQLEIIKPSNRECNSEADSSDPSERRDVHNFALSDVGKDDLVKNVVEQQKMTKEFCADLILSNEKNRNMAANHKVTDTLGTNTMKDLKKNNSIVDGENKVLDNGKQNPISEVCNVLEDSVNSETKGEPSCEVYEESPNVLSFEPFNIDDRKISINSTGLNIKTYSNRHKKLPKNKLSTVDTTIGGAHSGEEKSSGNPCDISKSEYSNELLHFSNELNSNSVEYQKSGGGVETYESAESQKDLFTDIAAKKADIDVLQDSLTSLGNIDDCSLQNLLDDEDDNIIKDIAKKLTVNSKRGQVKKKKDEAHNMNKRKNLPHSENTLLDLPIFSSSSEENDDSGDSNILSILDDSDNTEEESVNIISSHENQDDTPVQKILPKMELSGTKGSQNGNIIFRVIPKPFDKKKNIDSTWLDPTLDFEENFVNTNQHEITSPPMEQFTKSDKTLFKTYLDKANDTLCGKLDEKNRNEPVPSSQEIVGSNIKQKADANVNVPLTFVNISETPSVPYNQRRKTVSFLGIQPEANQKEKHFFKTPGDLTQSTFQQSSLPGKECWTAAINTYRSNSQLNMKSTAPSSSKDNVTPINLNSKSSSSFATDPGGNQNYGYIDEKLFKARVWIQRMDNESLLLRYLNNRGRNDRIKKNDFVRRHVSDFDKYLQQKRTGSHKRNKSKRSFYSRTSVSSSKSTNCKKEIDIKLSKKSVVLLTDIAKDPEYGNYFQTLGNSKKIIPNMLRKSNDTQKKSGRASAKCLVSGNQRGAFSVLIQKQDYTSQFRKRTSTDSPEIVINIFNNLKSNSKMSDKSAISKSKRRRCDGHNFNLERNSEMNKLSIDELRFDDVTSSVSPHFYSHSSIDTGQRNNLLREDAQNNTNKFRDLGYCINSYSRSVKNDKNDTSHDHMKRFGQDKSVVHNRLRKKYFITNIAKLENSHFRNEDDGGDNQVTSTQDNIPLASTTVGASKAPITEVDIQNDHIDTTLEESKSVGIIGFKGSGGELFPQQKNQTADYNEKKITTPSSKLDACDLPSTTTNIDFCNKNHDNISETENAVVTTKKAEDSKRINTKDDSTSISSRMSSFSRESDHEPLTNIRKRLNDSTNVAVVGSLNKFNLMDSTKTYSNVDSIKTVFVPPDIEKIIEAEDSLLH